MSHIDRTAAFLGAAFILACSHLATAAQNRVNILMILTDDMGYGDITAYGKGVGVPTRHIDNLATQGIKCDQFYVAAPICSPSRAAILTGRFPGRLKINTYEQTRAGNRECEQVDFLDPKVPTLPRLLKTAGYTTLHVGKWHLGGGRDVTDSPPFSAYGYDEWYGTWESPQPDPKLGIKYAPWDTRTEPGQVARHERTAYMVDRTLDFMTRNTTSPMFVAFWPDDVHTPHRPSPEMMKKYGGSSDVKKAELQNFRGVLDEYDRQIGRLLDGVTSMGLADNTIVIFTSDNGPAPHLDHTRTAGLRGMKLSLYEGGVREPFLVRWPGHIPAGKINSSTVFAALDLFPTLCKLAGVEIPSEIASNLDGEDMSAALLGKPQQRTKPLFWEYGRNEKSYGLPRVPIDKSPNIAARSGDWKLLVNRDGSHGELYNIPSDAKEKDEVTSANLAIAEKLTSRALEYRESLP